MRTKIFLKRNAPHICSMVAVAGVIGTGVLSARAAPKAKRLLDEAKQKEDNLSTFEQAKIVVPIFCPAILTGAITITAIFSADILSTRRQQSLTSAYMMLDQSFKNYKAKLKELYGEETHNNIINSLAIEKAKEVHVTASYLCSDCDLSLEDSGSKPVLFYESISERFFESTIEQVMSAEYHFNRNYILRGFCELNEFYDFLGLEVTKDGSELGWTPTDEGSYWIDFNHRKAKLEDGTTFYILEVMIDPFLYDEY